MGPLPTSFRDLKGGLEEIQKACVDAGISSVELMGTSIRALYGGTGKSGATPSIPQQPLTNEEQRSVGV